MRAPTEQDRMILASLGFGNGGLEMEVMGRWQHQHEQPATWCMRLEWWPRVVALAPWTHARSCWAMARRRGGGSRCRAGMRKRAGKNDEREKGCVHFYSRCRPVCQLPKDGEGICSILGDEFFSFFLKKYGWRRDMGYSWRCSKVSLVRQN